VCTQFTNVAAGLIAQPGRTRVGDPCPNVIYRCVSYVFDLWIAKVVIFDCRKCGSVWLIHTLNHSVSHSLTHPEVSCYFVYRIRGLAPVLILGRICYMT